jgi:hypothetical protein
MTEELTDAKRSTGDTTMFNESALKVNDKAGVIHSTGRSTNGFVGTVCKINHHGHIHVERDGDKHVVEFDKRGQQRGRKYGGLMLIDANDFQARKQREDAQRQRTETYRSLLERLKGHTNGLGHFCEISDEERAELIEIINSL